MTTKLFRTTFLTAATLAAIAVGASSASAQTFRPQPVARPVVPTARPANTIVSGTAFPNSYNYVNPNPYVGPGVKLNQWAYNTTAIGKTYSQFPPWMYGYNPYPVVANYGPVYRTPPIYTPYPYPTYPSYYPNYPYPSYAPGYSPLYTPAVNPYGSYTVPSGY